MSKGKDKEPSISLEDCLADFSKANEDVVREALSSNRDLRVFSGIFLRFYFFFIITIIVVT